MAKEKEKQKEPEKAKKVESKPAGVLRVRATELGFYNHLRRRPGDVFTLRPYKTMQVENGKKVEVIVSAEHQFSKKWMELVDKSTPEKVSTSQQALDATSAEIKRDKHMAKNAEDSAGDEGLLSETTGDAQVI